MNINKIIIILTVLAVSCSKPEHVDVLIIGGGASGISAGIQSSRMGVPAMIVEETPWVGGMLTAAGVSCVDGNYNLRSGIFGEFADSLAVRYGGWEALKSGWVSNINFDPHVGQEILTNMAEACGDRLQVRRETETLSVKKSDDGTWMVRLKGKEGRTYTVCADVLIDGTELGDVAKECGVEYRTGMDSSDSTGESIAPDEANDVIQDLTYVAFLKDYGPDADMTIEKPEGYDPSLFADSCINPLSDGVAETGQTVWPAGQMITYGRTPQGRYMINWPIYGNDYYANVIDASDEEREEAFAKARNFTLCFIYFIQDHLGMEIIPVSLKGDDVHGNKGYRRLSDIPGPIDVVDCFVNSARVGDVVDQAIAVGAKAVWLQLGVIDEAAARRAADAGLDVVMDTCPVIEAPHYGL